MSETWLTSTPNISSPFSSGDCAVIHSEAVRQFRRGRARGGLIVLVNASIYKLELIDRQENYIVVKIDSNKLNIIVCLVYVSPNEQFVNLLTKLDKVLYEVSLKYPDQVIIVGGDFNAKIGNLNQIKEYSIFENSSLSWIRSSVIQEENKKGKILVELFEENGFFVLNGRTKSDIPAQITYSDKGSSSILDLVWSNFEGAQLIKDLEVLHIPARSDHFPVVLTLFHENFSNIYNVNNKIKESTLRWKQENVETYREVIRYPADIGPLTSIDEMSERFIDSVRDAARESGMLVVANKRKTDGRPWYDLECVEKKKQLKDLLKKCKRDKFQHLILLEYEKCRKEYRKLIINKKESYKGLIVSQLTLCKSSTQFWKTVNNFKSKTINRDVIDLKNWEDYFGSIYPYQEGGTPPRMAMSEDNPFLSEPITLEETLLSLKKCKYGKAAGSNGVSYEFLKNLPGNLILYLNTLFNKIIEKGVVPKSWGQIDVRMIYKKGDMTNPDNYRPIALASNELKVFTQILSTRLTEWVERTQLLPEWQAGFRRGRSCLDHTFTLNAVIQSRLSQDKAKVYALFVDFRGAFPSLNHRILWERLYSMGCGSKFVGLLEDLYSKAYVSVRGNGGTSGSVRITRGILQGEVLSPTLFTLFLADLEEFLIDRGIRGVSLNHAMTMIILAYADDLVLLADSPGEMKRILLALYEYCHIKKLEVNIDKTKIVIFKKGGRSSKRKNGIVFKYGNSEIEIVKSYNYLGVIFSQSALFTDSMKMFMSKANLASNSTLSLIYKMRTLAWSSSIQLFQSMVSSVLLYLAQVWSLRYFEDMERVQTTFYKKLLHIPKCSPNYAVRVETGSTRISVCIFRFLLNWIEKILKMSDVRYPKKCFLRLRELSKRDDSKLKFNWALQVGSIFDDIEERESWDSLNLELIQKNKEKWLKKYEEKTIQEDLRRTSSSSSLCIYPYFNTCKGPQEYFKFKIPYKFISIFAQLRLLNKYQHRIIVQGKYLSLKTNSFCEFCHGEKNGIEYTLHVLIECEAIRAKRSMYIRDSVDLEEVSDYWIKILSKPDTNVIKNAFHFIESLI